MLMRRRLLWGLVACLCFVCGLLVWMHWRTFGRHKSDSGQRALASSFCREEDKSSSDPRLVRKKEVPRPWRKRFSWFKIDVRQVREASDDFDELVRLLAVEENPKEGLSEDLLVGENEILPVHPQQWVLPAVTLFIHIPKTAGFTFLNFFINTIYNQVRKEDSEKPPALRPNHCRSYCGCTEGYVVVPVSGGTDPRCRLFYGHVDYSAKVTLSQLTKTTVYSLTMLRDPVSRVVSQYHYIQEALPDHPVKRLNLTLEQYVTQYLPTERLDNLMVRTLAGVSDVQELYPREVSDYIATNPALMLTLAKRNLLSFTFFGVMEYFNESLEMLLYTFDMPSWNISYVSEHVLYKSRQPAGQQLERRIAKTDCLDVLLYEWAVPIFKARMKFIRKVQAKPSPSAQLAGTQSSVFSGPKLACKTIKPSDEYGEWFDKRRKGRNPVTISGVLAGYSCMLNTMQQSR